MVLHGKQLQLINLFSLQSLITLKKIRIYNPWELNGLTIQYRVNETTVDDLYARIAQSCSYLIAKVTEPTNTLTSYAVRVIWVVEDVKVGKSAVERYIPTLYSTSPTTFRSCPLLTLPVSNRSRCSQLAGNHYRAVSCSVELDTFWLQSLGQVERYRRSTISQEDEEARRIHRNVSARSRGPTGNT
jgi:hypothetical protein